MITHTSERKYICNYPGCGKRFGRSDNFAAYYRTHNKTTRSATKLNNKIQSNNCNSISRQVHGNNEIDRFPISMVHNDSVTTDSGLVTW
jgi:hypothetical protein